MMPRLPIPLIPANFFSIVLGMAGLGTAWRRAHQYWHLPAWVGETLMATASLVWALLLLLYAAKWCYARDEALAEAKHPVQCCFIGLAGVATMLIGGALLPYQRAGAEWLTAAGALFTATFTVWRTGALWQGERDQSNNTPVLYLPSVAGGFVSATMLGTLGYPKWGQMVFGAAAFSWLAIESVLLHRLYNGLALPPALRPTLGVQLAPPAVGLVASLAVTQGQPDMLQHALLGYAILQALILARLGAWIGQAGYAPAFWGFSFGLTALATAPVIIAMRSGSDDPAALLAPGLFVAVNCILLTLISLTLRLLLRGRLLPAASPPAAVPTQTAEGLR